jgi:hypothetical protein
MVYLPPAERALDVVSPIEVYRQIGRRPSKVYVDDAMNVTKSKKSAPHRLNDRVYWRTTAKPGDQIQDRPGGTLLVTAAGQCHPILLAEPQPLDPATAFTHQELAIKADRTVAERLLAEGKVAEATPRRPKGMPSRPSDRMLDDEHPIVVDKLPKGISPEDDAAASMRGPRPNWTRSQRPAPRS